MKVSVQRLRVEWMPLACRQIKRQAEICKPNDSEHLTGQPIPRRSILYIKGSAEETESILCRFGIHVGHKPCGTLRQLLMQPKNALSNQMPYTGSTEKGATPTTSENQKKTFKVEYANIKEQSGDETPRLLFGCTQLKLVTASDLKRLRLSPTTASKENA